MAAADVLSGLRLLAAPALPLLARRRGAFVAVAGFCALTDALDGPVARRAGTAGPRGARLDSLADAAFFGGLVAACVVAQPRRARAFVPALVTVSALRGAAALVGARRWGRPVLLHTWSDKAAGAATVGGAVALVGLGRPEPLAIATAVAVGAGAEDLWQVLTAAGLPDVDDPGLLGSVASRLVGRR